MANPSKGLGRGLAALLGDDVMTPEEENTSLYLPISQVESCASQPRKQFDPDALADLAIAIRSPITVRMFRWRTGCQQTIGQLNDKIFIRFVSGNPIQFVKQS